MSRGFLITDLLMSGGFPRYFSYVALAHSGTSPSPHLIDTDWGKRQLNDVSRPCLKFVLVEAVAHETPGGSAVVDVDDDDQFRRQDQRSRDA